MNWKKITIWGMYDLANTAFSALFVTFFFPFFIMEFLGGNEFHIGLVFGVSMFFVALIVPVLGAYSDQMQRRMPFIVLFTIACSIATALVGYVALVPALVLGAIANFCYHAALTTYNAILPTLARKEDMGKASGVGVGLGYLGTLMSLGMAALILMRYGWESKQGIALTFVATAIFFMLFSLVMFFGLKEKAKKKAASFRKAILEVRTTIRNIKQHRNLFIFLISMFLYIDAINAVIIFLYIYARNQIGLAVQGFMVVFIIFSLAAIVGSFVFGRMTDKLGAKRTLSLAGIMWIVVVGILLFSNSYTSFLLVGIIGGVALGAVWTAQRPYIVAITPKHQMAQFFGFLELTGKVSGILGPIVYGFLAAFYGYGAALTALIIFFLSGLIVLQKVEDAR